MAISHDIRHPAQSTCTVLFICGQWVSDRTLYHHLLVISHNAAIFFIQISSIPWLDVAHTMLQHLLYKINTHDPFIEKYIMPLIFFSINIKRVY